MRGVSLNILLPNGQRCRHVFPRNQCASNEVARICQACNIEHSENHYMVLISDDDRRIISVHFLTHTRDNHELKMVYGNRLVQNLVEKVRSLQELLITGQMRSPSEFQGWVESILYNCSLPSDVGGWFVGELVYIGGLEVLLITFRDLHREGSNDALMCLAAPLLAIFATILQFECGTEWIEDNLDLLEVEFFATILANIFGCRPGGECDFPCNSRRLAFAVISSVLKSFPETGILCHRAACKVVKKKGNFPLTYYHLMCQSAKDPDDPQYTICMALFNNMLQTNGAKREMVQAVKRISGGDGLAKQLNLDLMQRAAWMEELWLSNLVAAATDVELFAQRATEKLQSSDRVQQLQDQIQRVTKCKLKVDNDLRKAQKVAIKMSEFVCVTNPDTGTPNELVNKSLGAIIKYGWEQVKWNNGYTALHFAAECMTDNRVVELLGLLAPDVDCLDGDGLRPIDYARRECQYQNVKVLEDLRKRTYLDECATSMLSSKAGLSSKKQVELPRDLTPGLRASMEAVLEIGWDQIKWPNNSTALHLAAQSGNLQAVKILLESIDGVQKDINKVDDQGRRPVDYALKHGCNHVAEYLEWFSSNEGLTSRTMSDVGHSLLPLRREPPVPPKEIPAGVSTSLRGKCKEVQQKGWRNINWPGNHTALHEAVEMGDTEAIDFLLKCGADPNVKNDANKTSIDLAHKYNKSKCLQQLYAGVQAQASSILDAQRAVADRRAVTYESEPVRGSATTGAGGKYGCNSNNEQLQGTEFKVMCEKGKLARENNQLREQLLRMERENERRKNWEHERQQLCAKVKNLETQVETGKNGANIGPLTEHQTVEYLKHLRYFGADALRNKLQENKHAGGMALNEEEAASALIQMQCVDAETKLEHPTGTPVVRPGGNLCLKCGGCADGAVAPAAAAEKKEEVDAPKKGGKKGKAPPVPKKGGTVGGKGPPVKGGKPTAPDKGKGKGPAKGGDPWARKVAVKPEKPMKPFWWTCLKLGHNLVEKTTLWDDVQDLIPSVLVKDILADFMERFSKSTTVSKKRGIDMDEADVNMQPSKKVAALRIITDPALITGREAACRHLPHPSDLVTALLELDDVTLPTRLLELVFENCVPTAVQLKLLEETRAKNLTTPWALPESYMWHVGHVPAYEARIRCWLFSKTYEDKVQMYMEALQAFHGLMGAVSSCKSLPSILALILALGNYLNGGTPRGQADGFELTDLAKAESIRDNDGKRNLLHFAMDLFLQRSDHFESDRKAMFTELKPLMDNVRRRIVRDSDGAEKVEKQVLYVLEDFENMVQALLTEFDQMSNMLKLCLQYFEDPTDPLRTVLAEDFNVAKGKLDKMGSLKTEVRTLFRALQCRFHAESLTSSEFCLLWDNFLVPPELLTNKPPAMMSKHVLPVFCHQSRNIDLESMQILWDLRKPKEEEDKKKDVNGKNKSAPNTRNRLRRGKRMTIVETAAGA